MPSLKGAKRSAAFETIKKLYAIGELTDRLMPVNREICLKRYEQVYFKHWSHFKMGM